MNKGHNKNADDNSQKGLVLRINGDEDLSALLDQKLIEQRDEFMAGFKDIENMPLPKRAAHLAQLQTFIHAAERVANRAAGIDTKITYQVDESKYKDEIQLMGRIVISMPYSEAYKNELDLSVDSIHANMMRSEYMREVQECWDHLGPVHRKMALSHAQKIHAQTQNIAGVQNDLTLRILFNPVGKTPPPTPGGNPGVNYALYDDNLNDAAGLTGKPANDNNRNALPALKQKIHYNIHNDTNFLSRSFAEAMSVIHHEQHHAMQSALMLAFVQGRIPKAHPIAADIQTMWALREKGAYISAAIYSIYRNQHKERDTHYIEGRMRERLKLPLTPPKSAPTPK